jgi:hypothetical protein
MNSPEETATLERRVAWAKEHWGGFFSEMPLRYNEARLQDRVKLGSLLAEISRDAGGFDLMTERNAPAQNLSASNDSSRYPLNL